MVHRQSFLGLCFYLCVLLFSSSQVCGYQDSVPTGEKEADKTIFPETYPQKAEVFGDQSLEKMTIPMALVMKLCWNALLQRI